MSLDSVEFLRDLLEFVNYRNETLNENKTVQEIINEFTKETNRSYTVIDRDSNVVLQKRFLHLRGYFALKDSKHKSYHTEYHCRKSDIKKLLFGEL